MLVANNMSIIPWCFRGDAVDSRLEQWLIRLQRRMMCFGTTVERWWVQVYVLEGHPTDSRLCLSAGYDGVIIVWDPHTASEVIK